MFWDEDDKKTGFHIPDDVVDVGFKLNTKGLPYEHSRELQDAVNQLLPWIEDEELFGIHQIHGAESGNGWTRPENAENELLYLSRRARFYVRTPGHKLDEVKALTGQTLDVGGYAVELGASNVKPLSIQTEQFSRYVVVEDSEETEDDFLVRVVDDLKELLGVRVRKIMCGKPHMVWLPEGEIRTRSIMVADLEPAMAVKLQQHGVGRGRQFGCGLFVPHKGIKAVGETEDKTHFTGAK